MNIDFNQSGYNAVIDENDARGNSITEQPLMLLHLGIITTRTHRVFRVEKSISQRLVMKGGRFERDF